MRKSDSEDKPRRDLRRKKPPTVEGARLRMADLCARAEHCEYEITEKLRRMQLSSSQIREVLDFLIQERFVDNARYAAAYARDKVRFSAWGRAKIRMYLASKRIPAALIADALNEIDDKDYAEALSRAACFKAKELDLSDYEDRTKLYRHLASRGFESALISREIGRLRKASEE